ncbi:MAG: stage III sporulation protein AF [Methylocystaceae bacterium]
MMELLISMVRNLVIIIIVAMLLELVMPPGKLRPLVQMTIGFFVIITILNPVLNLVFHHEQMGINSYTLPEEVNRKLNQALVTGKDVNQMMQTDMKEQLRDRVEGQIRSLALLVPGVGDIKPVVKLDARGNIQEVNLLVKVGEGQIGPVDERLPAFAGQLSSPADPDLERKLKDWISSYYQVTPDQIKINWR